MSSLAIPEPAVENESTNENENVASTHEVHRYLTPAEEATILKLHAQGMSGHQIAESVGRHNSIVYRFLNRHNKTATNEPRKLVTERQKSQIVAMHKDGKSEGFIASSLRLGRSTIHRHLVQSGVPLEPKSPNQNPVTAAEVKEILRRRKAGQTRTEIARAIGRSESTVDRTVKQAGLVHPLGQQRPQTPIDAKKVLQLRNSGVTMQAIIAQMGMSTATFYTRLKTQGIKLPPLVGKAGRPQGTKNKKKDAYVFAPSASPTATANILPKNGKFHCPECGEPFKLRKTLGIHRRHQHGILGTSMSAAKHRAERAAHQPEPTNTPREETNGNQPNHSENDEIKTHCAYLFGKFQGELQSYADSQDLPWKVLASGVARLFEFSTAQIRSRLGRTHRVPALSGETP